MRNLRYLIYISTFLIWAEGLPFFNQKLQFVYIAGRQVFPTDILFVLLFFWALGNFKRIKRGIRRNDLHQKKIAFFMLWGILPLINGWLSGNANLLANMRIFAWGLIALAGPFAFRSLDQFYKFIYYYLSLHSIRVVLYYFTLIFIEDTFTQINIFNSRDALAGTILLAAFAFFSKGKKTYERLLVNFMFPLSALMIILNQKRSYYIAFILILIIFIFNANRKQMIFNKKMARYAVITGIIISALLTYKSADIMVMVQNRIGNIIYYEQDLSAMTRLVRWSITLDRIKGRPILGHGSGVDTVVFTNTRVGIGTPHNAFLEMALWGGSITVLLFLVVQGAIARSCIKIGKRAPPRYKVIILGGGAMIIGMVVSSAFGLLAGSLYFSFWFYPMIALISLKLYKRDSLKVPE